MSADKEQATVKDNIEETLDDAIEQVTEDVEISSEEEISELETLKGELEKEKDKDKSETTKKKTHEDIINEEI